MKVRFLIDENLAPYIKTALLRYDTDIDVARVGDEGILPLGSLDPDILRYVESTQRFLVTDNRRSIPIHLEAHWATGGHIWGVGWVRPQIGVRHLAEELYLIWSASEAEEWLDRVEWLPL